MSFEDSDSMHSVEMWPAHDAFPKVKGDTTTLAPERSKTYEEALRSSAAIGIRPIHPDDSHLRTSSQAAFTKPDADTSHFSKRSFGIWSHEEAAGSSSQLSTWLDGIGGAFEDPGGDTTSSPRARPISTATAIASDPNFFSGIAESSPPISSWLWQPRHPPEALSSRYASRASSKRAPLSVTSLSSSRLNSRRTKEQLLEGDREHRCSECSAGFHTKSELSHHMRYHKPMEQRPYGCDECEKRFLYPKDLQRHKLVHSPKRIFCPHAGCKYCEKGFTRWDTLERHLTSKHAPEKNDFPSRSPPLSIRSITLDQTPSMKSHPAGQETPEHTKSSTEATLAISEAHDPPLDPHFESQLRVLGSHENAPNFPRSHSTQRPKRPISRGRQLQGRPASQFHDESNVSDWKPCPSSSDAAVPSESSSLGDNECRCDPPTCRADACTLAERTKGRKPDIRRLFAFLTLHGAEQSAHNTTCGTDGENDTKRRVERAAMSLLKRPRLNKRNDDGDRKAPEQASSETMSPAEAEMRFKCPIAADCPLVELGFMCSCCKWDGSPRFCDVRAHLERAHVHKPSGLFKHIERHNCLTVAFKGLDTELQRLEKLKTNGVEKWRFAYKYLHPMPDEAEPPNAFVDRTAAHRFIEQFLQLTEERDFFRDIDSLLSTGALYSGSEQQRGSLRPRQQQDLNTNAESRVEQSIMSRDGESADAFTTPFVPTWESLPVSTSLHSDQSQIHVPREWRALGSIENSSWGGDPEFPNHPTSNGEANSTAGLEAAPASVSVPSLASASGSSPHSGTHPSLPPAEVQSQVETSQLKIPDQVPSDFAELDNVFDFDSGFELTDQGQIGFDRNIPALPETTPTHETFAVAAAGTVPTRTDRKRSWSQVDP